MIALVTAIYGGHDDLHEIPEHIECDDAVCVTDDPDLRSETWRIVYEPRPEMHPNRAAKPPKMCPWRYTTCDSSVWLDAAYEITWPRFPTEAISHAQPYAAHLHPARDCIFTEANLSITMAKYDGEPIAKQAQAYREAGHPEHWGLWENGCTARLHTPEVVEMCEDWLAEIERTSFQDQISGPFLFRVHGIRPAIIPRMGLIHRPSPRHTASYQTRHPLSGLAVTRLGQ